MFSQKLLKNCLKSSTSMFIPPKVKICLKSSSTSMFSQHVLKICLKSPSTSTFSQHFWKIYLKSSASIFNQNKLFLISTTAFKNNLVQ